LQLGTSVDLTVSEPGATRIVDRENSVALGSKIVELFVSVLRHRRILPTPCDNPNWRD
jgi:hypothetical protein